VRNVIRGLSDSPATPAEVPLSPPASAPEDPPQSLRIFQSPSLISDAVRRLALSSADHQPRNTDQRKAGDPNNILRIMTNLLTFSQQKHGKEGEAKPLGDILKSYALLSATPRRSMIFFASTNNLAGADKKVAVDYIFSSTTSLSDVCNQNAAYAASHGRTDHERTFQMLAAVLSDTSGDSVNFTPLGIRIVRELWVYFVFASDLRLIHNKLLGLLEEQGYPNDGHDLCSHTSGIPTSNHTY
jgi:WD repeat-containing protein 59